MEEFIVCLDKGKYLQQISITEEGRDLPESGDLPKGVKESEMMMKLRLSLQTCNASIRLQLQLQLPDSHKSFTATPGLITASIHSHSTH